MCVCVCGSVCSSVRVAVWQCVPVPECGSVCKERGKGGREGERKESYTGGVRKSRCSARASMSVSVCVAVCVYREKEKMGAEGELYRRREEKQV